MSHSSTTEIPADQNILLHVTEHLLQRTDTYPDYSNTVVILPDSQAKQQLLQTLATVAGIDAAIIPPWCGTLQQWVTGQIQRPDHYTVINRHERQLMFIDALLDYPHLFKDENKWQVADALLTLFDELELNQDIIFESESELAAHLVTGYGINDNEKIPDHLGVESKLVYTLWRAWKTQLAENQLHDETTAYLACLQIKDIDPRIQFICVDTVAYCHAEKSFINNLVSQKRCKLFNTTMALADSLTTDPGAGSNPGSTYTFIQQAYKLTSLSLLDRATEFQQSASSPPPIKTFLATNDEEQIRAIDFYIRRAMLNNRANIAVISEDRKLSRRLRAVLERTNVKLHDFAGWSLATTQASTIIERWLVCIEEDFDAFALLDCLKSPFINLSSLFVEDESDPSPVNEQFKRNIYRFEHDIVFHENVSRDIDKYREALKDRLSRLTHWPANSYTELTMTLDFIQATAIPLVNLQQRDGKIPLAEFINTLLESLEALGVLQQYANDEAGLIILKLFRLLQASTGITPGNDASTVNPDLSWHDCRLWLAKSLESENFVPGINDRTSDFSIKLMTLEQTRLQQFDAVIIAACDPQHYPGSANISPLFNQSVRASLNLPTWEQQRQQRHELFIQSLLSASEVLITACNQEKGEQRPVSPWLELLINFHQLVYKDDMQDRELCQLVKQYTNIQYTDDNSLPEEAEMPAPALAKDLIPAKLSASAHQRLINCPYQFFSADSLKLKPLEELSDELRKSDYGERIHLVLQCFHAGNSRYGDAFALAITGENRNAAIQHLEKLSEKIFTEDIENNVLHRSWLHRWNQMIPAYIDWQIKHQIDWKFLASEQHIEKNISNKLAVYGRLDRIDSNVEKQHNIIDYKTGRTAGQDEVDNGENVQLATYALLDENASDVTYLSVDSADGKITEKATLSDDELEASREATRMRLLSMFDAIHDGQVLPAWGDEAACQFCQFSGLCRRQEWFK